MKYKVMLHYSSYITVEVEASSGEEARIKANRDFQGRSTPEEIMPHLTRLPDYDQVRLVREAIPYDFCMSRLLPPDRKGDWEIRQAIIPAGQSVALYDRGGGISIGELTFDYPVVRLSDKGTIWMSDSPLEVESYRGPQEQARGDCLISGLGIGLLPTMIKGRVNSVDIVEFNQDVIDLVFPRIATSGMRIIRDDLFHYLSTTEKRYDFIHIDIWGDITAPVREIENARQKAMRCLRPGGVIWCWLQELYDRIKNQMPEGEITPGRLQRYEPCLICGNSLRENYGGLCTLCAAAMGIKTTGSRE